MALRARAKSPATGARYAQAKRDSSGPRYDPSAYRGRITSRTDRIDPPDQQLRRSTVAPIQSKELQAIYDEAEDRFHMCENWEKDTRRLFLEDLKFANADPDNGFQWPNHMRRNRDVDQRPALTINKTRQHNLQVKNDMKQNKAAIVVKPTGDGASYKSAQIFQYVVRDIERQSHAEVHYDIACEGQVDGGIGYVKVNTDYVDDKSFDQDIMIKGVRDPLSVYLDRDIQERDGSDARYGFQFEDWPKDRFEKEFPQYAKMGATSTLGSGDNWIDREHIRMCDYWRRVEKKDKLVALENAVATPEGKSVIFERLSRIRDLFKDDEETVSQLLNMPGTRTRRIVTHDMEWIRIVGHTVVERKPWPGKYVPIVRFVGEETIIDGKLDRKGHTRNLKDAQRVYNYWTSAAVEHIALQSKTPWVVPIQAMEGYETYWSTANRINHSYLPYNAIDDDGNPIPVPERIKPPEMSEAYLKGMETAGNEMMMASGQWQAQMGQNENAKSGKAISERQRQGDNATYHFINNQAVALRHLGRIIVDLIPKIYDTKRVKLISASDNRQHAVTIDPMHPEAHTITNDLRTAEAIESIFNPTVGRYSVEADMGPSYATQRQEALEAFTQLIGANKEFATVLGDLFFRNADFPDADEAAERLRRMIPAHILGEGPTGAEMQLQQQVQMMTQEMSKQVAMNRDLTSKIADEKIRTRTREEKRDIDAYNALTKRVEALGKMMVNPKDAAQMWHDLMMQERQAHLDQIFQGDNSAPPTEGGGDNASPAAGGGQGGAPGAGGAYQGEIMHPAQLGARQAPDGHHYLPDKRPGREGKYLRVEMNAAPG
jgi:hypothetical protein